MWKKEGVRHQQDSNLRPQRGTDMVVIKVSIDILICRRNHLAMVSYYPLIKELALACKSQKGHYPTAQALPESFSASHDDQNILSSLVLREAGYIDI